MQALEPIIEKVKKYFPEVDEARIRAAYIYACEKHAGQERNSGEAYIVHPLTVAGILADLSMDVNTIIAALLHDTLEDSDATPEEIEAKFGKDVLMLVKGVTNLSQLEFSSKEEQQIENQRKMIMAMAKDLRVVLIKLADRLHNMRTMRFNSHASQVDNARETLEIYAPLAHRLGIYSVKWELEDLALRYLHPEEYFELVRLVDMKREEREAMIETIIEVLKVKLAEANIEASLMGRPKHFYSIYNKMKNQGKTFEELYDLTGVRVLVNTVQDCYAALGVIHTTWTYLPQRFKDYIGHKKSNLYQSLHTTLMAEGGKTFEVQIRTYEMHQVAEYGVAAHWKYKEGKSGDDFDVKMAWIRQLLELQNTFSDSREFLDSLKRDVFAEEVFVFTPKGDVFNLPLGSTAVDFAYSIHTSVGNRCVGAKVDNRIVPLDYQLKTGDSIQILTSTVEKGPGRDWEKFVHLSSTKAKIRAYFKKADRDSSIATGREMLEREAKRHNKHLGDLTKPELMAVLITRYFTDPRHPGTQENLFADVGFGLLSANRVVTLLVEELDRLSGKEKEKEKPETFEVLSDGSSQLKRQIEQRDHKSSILVQGEDKVEFRFARCCNPVPPDPIMGFTTRNRGVTVHKVGCSNLQYEIEQEPHRQIEVSWGDTSEGAYNAVLAVVVYSKHEIISSLMRVLDDLKVPLLGMTFSNMINPTTNVQLTVVVQDTNQLNKVIQKLRGMSDVINVTRSVSL